MFRLNTSTYRRKAAYTSGYVILATVANCTGTEKRRSVGGKRIGQKGDGAHGSWVLGLPRWSLIGEAGVMGDGGVNQRCNSRCMIRVYMHPNSWCFQTAVIEAIADDAFVSKGIHHQR